MPLRVDDPRDIQTAYEDQFNKGSQADYGNRFKNIDDAENRGAERFGDAA